MCNLQAVPQLCQVMAREQGAAPPRLQVRLLDSGRRGRLYSYATLPLPDREGPQAGLAVQNVLVPPQVEVEGPVALPAPAVVPVVVPAVVPVPVARKVAPDAPQPPAPAQAVDGAAVAGQMVALVSTMQDLLVTMDRRLEDLANYMEEALAIKDRMKALLSCIGQALPNNGAPAPAGELSAAPC
jgi:hypothetical protein